MSVDFFINERYKILSCMAERQIDVNGKVYVPLSQQEISDIVGISKRTVNIIIKELKANDYITQHSKTRGKYSLTQKALTALKSIQK